MSAASDTQCFTSTNYSCELLRNLNRLLQSGTFCDVKLQLADGRSVCAHRNVLSAASPYFHAMFTGGLRETCLETVDTSHVAQPHIMDRLIDFMYTGCLSVTSETAQDLLEAADLLQLTHVIDVCCTYLRQQLDVSNCIGIYMFADTHSCVELRSSAESFILLNFANVSRCEEFPRLSLEDVLRLLRSDEIHIECETQILDAALRWLLSDVVTRRRHVYDIFAAVRLPLIPRSQCDQITSTCDDLGVKIVLQTLLVDVHGSRNVATSEPRRHARRSVYIIGGYSRAPGARWSETQTLSSAECYDSFLHTWRTVPPLRFARSGACVVALNGAVYALGGESDSLICDTVECFDPIASNRWRVVEPMPMPRCSAGVCAINGLLYVFGGWIGSEISKTVEVYNCQQNEWSRLETQGGTPRFAMGVVECQGLVYLVGGSNEFNTEFSSVDVFDPVSLRWLRAADMNTRRVHTAAVSLYGYIYVVGGLNERDGVLDSVERYSVEQDTWTFVNPMFTPRAGLCLAAVNGCIYAFGGRSSLESSAPATLTSVERYDPQTDEWTDAGHMLHSRCEGGVAVL